MQSKCVVIVTLPRAEPLIGYAEYLFSGDLPTVRARERRVVQRALARLLEGIFSAKRDQLAQMLYENGFIRISQGVYLGDCTSARKVAKFVYEFFNTPMSKYLGRLADAIDKEFPNLSPADKEFLKELVREMVQKKSLIDALLGIGYATQAKAVVIPIDPVSAASVLAEAVAHQIKLIDAYIGKARNEELYTERARKAFVSRAITEAEVLEKVLEEGDPKLEVAVKSELSKMPRSVLVSVLDFFKRVQQHLGVNLNKLIDVIESVVAGA